MSVDYVILDNTSIMSFATNLSRPVVSERQLTVKPRFLGCHIYFSLDFSVTKQPSPPIVVHGVEIMSI